MSLDESLSLLLVHYDVELSTAVGPVERQLNGESKVVN